MVRIFLSWILKKFSFGRLNYSPLQMKIKIGPPSYPSTDTDAIGPDGRVREEFAEQFKVQIHNRVENLILGEHINGRKITYHSPLASKVRLIAEKVEEDEDAVLIRIAENPENYILLNSLDIDSVDAKKDYKEVAHDVWKFIWSRSARLVLLLMKYGTLKKKYENGTHIFALPVEEAKQLSTKLPQRNWNGEAEVLVVVNPATRRLEYFGHREFETKFKLDVRRAKGFSDEYYEKIFPELMSGLTNGTKQEILTITGLPGSGKTMLAEALRNYLADMGRESALLHSDWFFNYNNHSPRLKQFYHMAVAAFFVHVPWM